MNAHLIVWATLVNFLLLRVQKKNNNNTMQLPHGKQHDVASDTLWNEVTSKSLVRWWPPSPWFLHPARMQLVI
jgi:hypothetical protein